MHSLTSAVPSAVLQCLPSSPIPGHWSVCWPPRNICTAASPTWLWLRHRKQHGCEKGCDTGSSTHSSILLSSVIRVLPILKTTKAWFLKASTSTSCGIMASRLFYLQLVGEICQGKKWFNQKTWMPRLRNDLWKQTECSLLRSSKCFLSPGNSSSRAARYNILQLLRENWWHLLPSLLLFRRGKMIKLQEIISISQSYCWDDRRCTDFPREYHVSVKNILIVGNCKAWNYPQPGIFSTSPPMFTAKKFLVFLLVIYWPRKKKETQYVILKLLLIPWIIDSIFHKGPKQCLLGICRKMPHQQLWK